MKNILLLTFFLISLCGFSQTRGGLVVKNLTLIDSFQVDECNRVTNVYLYKNNGKGYANEHRWATKWAVERITKRTDGSSAWSIYALDDSTGIVQWVKLKARKNIYDIH